MTNLKRETIRYNGQNYHRYPDSKNRQHRVYYWKHDKCNEAPVALHRQIWIDNFGKIPKNHCIHHKDGDTSNNAIKNLAKLTRKQHAVLHMIKRKKKKIGICETCERKFVYFSVRKAKFCSYKCYSVARRARERAKLDKNAQKSGSV